jgi:DNA transposition AAA+ family ATPase
MKEDFISDKRRLSYLSATYSRIYRGQSVLIEGDFGAGKTRFLKLLRPKKRHAIWVESLFNIHETLASILQELNYDTRATYRRTPRYLKMICGLSNCFIIIDEANDLDTRVWPYFKRIIDAGVPVVFAGLPKVRTWLSHNHPDILSRLKTLISWWKILSRNIKTSSRRPSNRFIWRSKAICASSTKSVQTAGTGQRN